MMPAARRWGGLTLYATPAPVPRDGVYRWRGRIPGRGCDLWSRVATVAEMDAVIASTPAPVSVERAAELYLGGVHVDADGRPRGGAQLRRALDAVGLELRGRHVYADPERWDGATGAEVMRYFAEGA